MRIKHYYSSDKECVEFQKLIEHLVKEQRYCFIVYPDTQIVETHGSDGIFDYVMFPVIRLEIFDDPKDCESEYIRVSSISKDGTELIEVNYLFATEEEYDCRLARTYTDAIDIINYFTDIHNRHKY